jgi:hypothetical protein
MLERRHFDFNNIDTLRFCRLNVTIRDELVQLSHLSSQEEFLANCIKKGNWTGTVILT